VLRLSSGSRRLSGSEFTSRRARNSKTPTTETVQSISRYNQLPLSGRPVDDHPTAQGTTQGVRPQVTLYRPRCRTLSANDAEPWSCPAGVRVTLTVTPRRARMSGHVTSETSPPLDPARQTARRPRVRRCPVHRARCRPAVGRPSGSWSSSRSRRTDCSSSWTSPASARRSRRPGCVDISPNGLFCADAPFYGNFRQFYTCPKLPKSKSHALSVFLSSP